MVAVTTVVLGTCEVLGISYLLAFLAMGLTVANASDRAREMRREDGEDSTSYRDFTRLLDERHARVAGVDEDLDQGVAIDRLCNLEVDAASAYAVAGRHAECECGPRRDRYRRRQGSILRVRGG